MFSHSKVTWLPSPAKLNLFLHICGRLDNGYHSLQSIFQILDYGDEVGFQLGQEEPAIVLKNNIEGLATKDNLIYRAAHALLPFRKNQHAIEISLRKVLPMGGGIGGGSSNAATVLVTLNIIWECGLSLEQLANIGLQLGADVPVFVKGQTAFANGVGEQLQAIELPIKYYLVATPDVQVSTADVFGHPELPRATPRICIDDYCFENTANDCQTLVTTMHSKVAKLLQWLLHYAPSRMTGTGASVFAIFDNKAKALEVLENLPEGVRGFVAKGVNRSPLHDALIDYIPD
ncbi:4-(cytidine 5'-diphospho)-2-C-methyl-D-erythritol kinase [Glaciecola sp. SC05]|uniref:4-(cytidine 5'-diphospho)-2-C-methyl-D-erythritol kinase n=1 Tax=Glaciecola sp. SC05 TaxID=1987355 RepID=UPI003527737B